MASDLKWQQQAVGQFLDQVNWLGLVSSASVAGNPTTNWLFLSVREFWQEQNWDGRRPARLISSTTPAFNPAIVEHESWLNWSVAEFIGAVNWPGHAISVAPIMDVPGPATQAPAPTSWQQLTLTDFFERVNWSGLPTQIQVMPGTVSPLRLSVKQFLATVAWDIKPMIASVPVRPPEPEPAEPDSAMTLTDLSSLF